MLCFPSDGPNQERLPSKNSTSTGNRPGPFRPRRLQPSWPTRCDHFTRRCVESQRRRDAPASASTSRPSHLPIASPGHHAASKRAKVTPTPLLALLVCSHRPGRKLHADLCSFARKGRSEGRGQGRRVRVIYLLVDAHDDADDADALAHVAALVGVGVDAGGNSRYRHSGGASVSKCCLLFVSKGVGIGAIRFGVSVERSLLQSFQSNNSFEKTWGKGW